MFFYFCYSNEGTCQLYNSTECHEYLAGTYVYIKPPKHLKRLEKQLRRWFKESKCKVFFSTRIIAYRKAHPASYPILGFCLPTFKSVWDIVFQMVTLERSFKKSDWLFIRVETRKD